MAIYKIVASPLANASYLNNIEYLENYWSQKEVIQFIKKVEDVIAILKYEPKTFKKWDKDINIHCIEIVKQITLYYQINNLNVELLVFFNNHQDPYSLRKLLL
jgi:hypothetical protein